MRLRKITTQPPSRKSFDDVARQHDERDAQRLLANGLYPSAEGFLNRECPTCSACIATRIPIDQFDSDATSEHRRIKRKNDDLENTDDRKTGLSEIKQGLPNLDFGPRGNPHLNVLTRYEEKRFGRSDTDRVIKNLRELKRFQGFKTFHLDLADANGQLVGSMIFHRAGDSVYGTKFFYEPDARNQGVGHFMILGLIERLRKENVKYLYLGHWTNSPSGLSWKDKFTPIELLIDGQWILHDKATIRARRQDPKKAYPGRRQLITS